MITPQDFLASINWTEDLNPQPFQDQMRQLLGMMKALSILQPWAWLICEGLKDIENRTWKPWNPGLKFRGRVLVHAGKGYDDGFDPEWARKICGREIPAKAFFDDKRGGIVGVTTITDCVTQHPSPCFFGAQGFVLEQSRHLPFTPCRGQLGFFKPQYPAPATVVADLVSDQERKA